MSRSVAALGVLLTGILLLACAATGQYPNCNWGCTANDVYVSEVYVDAPEVCAVGEPVTAGLYVTFHNGTRTDRYAVRLLGDLYVGNAWEESLDECVSDAMSPGTSSVLIAFVSWTCGEAVELRNVVVSWTASPEACGETPSCSARTAKCWQSSVILIRGTPLSVGFSSDASACEGEAVRFVSEVAGGRTPYAYAWDFGDGGASASANPSHVYPGPGTYAATLTVTDSGGASASATDFIEVAPKPPADAWNDGPFCPGETISLFSSGGVAFEWTGPNGFASSEQDPTIDGASPSDAGIYTVIVTNEYGCADGASTLVEIDATPPVLELPADVVVECGGSTDPAGTGEATATDDTDPFPIVSYTDAASSNPCGGMIERMWIATDACGNTASGLQTIEIVDTTPPILTVSSAQFECDGAGNEAEIAGWLASALATDACGDAVVTHDFTGLGGACGGTGSVSVTFTAVDPCGNVTEREATLSVVDTTPPDTLGDVAVTDEGTPVSIDVLANDVDTCDPSPELIDVGTPGFGAAEINGGRIRYAPSAGFDGTDSFSYTIEDCSGNTDSALVEVTVLPVNDPPLANDRAATTQEDTPLSLTVTATDPDGDALSYAILSGPSHGTIDGFDPATGALRYTPDADYNGPDSFAFEACDPDGLCDVGTVTISIEPADDPPTADPQTLTTPEETPLPITLTGSDVDGDLLTYGIASGPSHGTIDGFDPTTGALLYTPDADFAGTDAFVFEACDPDPEHGCAHATVTIVVTPVNDPPLAQDQTRTTTEDTATGTFALLISDPDDTLAELSCDCLSPPQRGTVERGPNHTVNYTPDSDFSGTDTFRYLVCDPDGSCDTATVTVIVIAAPDPPVARDDAASVAEDGSVSIDVPRNDIDPDGDLDPTSVLVLSGPANGTATVDPVTGAIRYEPAPDFNGDDAFTYEICDREGACDTATVTVHVVPVADPPVARDDADDVLEDGAVTIDVAANDTDPDGDLDPTTVSVISPPANGAVTVDPMTGTIRYEPDPDFDGVDSFTYEICDREGVCDAATVTIDVVPVNDPPTAKDDATSTGENVPVVLDVTANDADPDGNLDPTTVEIASPAANGTVEVDRSTGQITYTPNERFFGTDAFAYRVCDAGGLCDTATVTVNVGPSGDGPIALDDAVEVIEDGLTVIDVLANDQDPDGNLDPTSVTLVSPPTHGFYSVDPVTGTITYAPDAGYNGQDVLTYQVCDTDGECDTATVTITVLSVDDPPIARDDAATVAEDGSVSIDVAGNDADPDGDLDPTTISVTSSPASGTATVDPATGRIRYEPNPDFNGDDAFTYEICDRGGACDTATVRIRVTPVDDPPVAVDDAAAVVEDGSVRIDVFANDSDPDGDLDATSVSIVDPPNHGRVLVDPVTGAVTYEPAPNFNGDDAFTYEICDSERVCATASVTVVVTPRNDPPVAVCVEATVSAGTIAPIQLLGRDPDGDALTYRITSAPSRGTLTQPDDEGLLYYSTQGEGPLSGPISFTFEVCDPAGACDTCVVQLLVVRVAGGGGTGACRQRVVISEVAWSGTDASSSHEWIELRNMEDAPVDLEGWTLRWRRKVAETGERRLWKAIPLSGVIGARASGAGVEFTPDDGQPGAWWVVWNPEVRDDFFLVERTPGEAVLHVPADLVYEDALLLGRVADLDDRGEVVELVDPFGCVVDTANADLPERDGWGAGDLWPTATMERTDASGADLDGNWHTNLGLVRSEFDAWANLIHGTPKHENSPVLADAAAAAGIAMAMRPMGEPIVLRFDPLPEWPADEGLWRVIVTRPPEDELLEAAWSIAESENGDVLVELDVRRLPLDVEIHVWVRTPSGDLLFAPFLLYPY